MQKVEVLFREANLRFRGGSKTRYKKGGQEKWDGSHKSEESSLCLQLANNSRAVTVTLHIDANPLQEGQPDVIQRGAFIEDEVLPQFEIGASTGD